jgi:hypothetical protein
MSIMYASRTISPGRRKLKYQRKRNAVTLWGMEKFEYFLKGRKFILITDHIALKALNGKGEIKSARIAR